MPLLDAWMPVFEVAARYSVLIGASREAVYAALRATDFSRPWPVRTLMGARLLPALLRSPRRTWRRFRRPAGASRVSLAELEHSDFTLLEEAPGQEIVLGITGRFWTLAAEIVPVPPEHFCDPLPLGLAQAVWNFEVTETEGGTQLATETRVRCADPTTRRQFRRYWRVVAPGSGLIRHAILAQVRRETLAGVG